MAAGLAVTRVEIDKNGKTVVFTGQGGEVTTGNEWDTVAS